MRFFSLILFTSLVSSPLKAALVELARGGKINIDLNEWQIITSDSIVIKESMVIIHKKTSLKGVLLDGTIKDHSPCKVETNAWKTCQKSSEISKKKSQQIYLARKVASKVYQTYVVSFNYPKDKEVEFSKVVNKFEQAMVEK